MGDPDKEIALCLGLESEKNLENLEKKLEPWSRRWAEKTSFQPDPQFICTEVRNGEISSGLFKDSQSFFLIILF